LKNRVNKSKIYRNRSIKVSKTEVENPEYMRKQLFSDKEITQMQEKLLQWKKDHVWECKCGKINDDLVFNCECCDSRKY